MSRRFCCSLLWPALVSAGCVLGTVGNMEGKGWDPCFWGPLLASTVLSRRWSRALPGCFGNSEFQTLFQTWIRLCVLIRFPVIYVQDKFVKTGWVSRKNNNYRDLERDEVQRRLWLKFFLFGVLFQFQSRFILELQSECSVLGELLIWTSRMGTFSWSRLGQSLHSWQAPSSAQYTSVTVSISDSFWPGTGLTPLQHTTSQGVESSNVLPYCSCISDPGGTVSLRLRVRTVQESFSDMKTLKRGI